MFEITDQQGNPLRVRFQHLPGKKLRKELTDRKAFGQLKRLRRVTTCGIYTAEGNLLGQGVAQLHRADELVFNKELGRRTAFTRALASAFPGTGRDAPDSRAVRVSAWETYWAWRAKEERLKGEAEEAETRARISELRFVLVTALADHMTVLGITDAETSDPHIEAIERMLEDLGLTKVDSTTLEILEETNDVPPAPAEETPDPAPTEVGADQ